MAKTVLLCPPTYFDVLDMKNPYMVGDSPVDRDKARRQWETLRGLLEESGLKVETIDPVRDLEDMVFAANQVFVGRSDKIGKFIVPSRMRFASRQREVPYYIEWFRKRGYKIINLELGDDYLEGHGDLLWHPDHSRVYAAYGFRSTRGGVEKFAAAVKKLDIPVVPLQLVDEHCYHLDTCLCALNSHTALIYPGAYTKESLERLRKCWARVHELTREEAHNFMGNGIVAGGRYITPHLTPHLEEILRKENLNPVLVDTSEYEKSGGSCFCMKAVID